MFKELVQLKFKKLFKKYIERNIFEKILKNQLKYYEILRS